MPQNNPGREGLGGETVFIDPSALNEIPHHLMHQDIEALVALNIQSSDLNLQESQETSNILLHDGVSVSNVIDSASKDSIMDTSDTLQTTQPMEVDSLQDASHVLGDIDLLHQSHDLMPMENHDLIGETSQSEELPSDSSNMLSSSPPSMEGPNKNSHQLFKEEQMPPHQILKSNVGQFVILQPNQESISLSSIAHSGRIYSAGTQFQTSISSVSNNLGPKSVYVNANQLDSSLKQVGSLVQSPQTQFRTLQLKQPMSLTQLPNSTGVTKVIINSQPGNNLGQQLRLITSQSSGNASSENSILEESNSNPKLTIQFQPMNIALQNAKTAPQTSTKMAIQETKLGTKLKMPISFSIRQQQPSTVIASSNTLQTVSAENQSLTGLSVGTNVMSKGNPHKILLKGNIPLSSVQSNSQLKPGQILATTGIKFSQNNIQPSSQPATSLPNKLNYVRLVNTNSSVANSLSSVSSIVTTATTTSFSTISQSAIQVTSASTAPKMKVKGLTIAATQSNSKQRVIIPLNNNNFQSNVNSGGNLSVRPQGSITLPASALPPGMLSNAQPGSLVMIPAHYFQNNATSGNSQLLQVATSGSSAPTPVPISSANEKSLALPPQPARTVIDANGIKPRKPCNCTKSQCLKLYCDCFANGEFCNNCNCANCFNNLTHEEDRQKAIRSCLERNPQAFRPKIGKGGTESERRHNKGCNCKRSGCLKNYCECYEAKIPCSSMCKCVSCRNIDSCHPLPMRKKFIHLPDSGANNQSQKIYTKSRPPLLLSSLPSPTKMSFASGGKSTYCRINQEVVEATCQCLLAQAEKAEKSNNLKKMELLVVDEFSRCLLQIIGCNTKSNLRHE